MFKLISWTGWTKEDWLSFLDSAGSIIAVTLTTIMLFVLGIFATIDFGIPGLIVYLTLVAILVYKIVTYRRKL